MLPSPPDPVPLLVAVIDLLGFKSHLWDKSCTPIPGGLTKLYEKYTLFLSAKGHSVAGDYYHLTPEQQIERVDYRIPHVVASDTVMLWAPEDQGHHLVSAVAQFVNLGMTFQVPLRGAISFGDCIFDLRNGMFIGLPVVEALEAEKVQEWIGVGVLPAASEKLINHPGVVEYKVPLKPRSNLVLNHAIAWHRADDDPSAPGVRVQRLLETATDDVEIKYLNTLEFIREMGEAVCGVSS